MKKSNVGLLFIFILSSCRTTSLPSSSSLSTSIIPIPTNDFDSLVNGRNILKETRISQSYQQDNLNDLNPLPLLAVNFPRTNQVTAYTVANATLGSFANQSINFANQEADARNLLINLPIGERVSQSIAETVLNTMKITDEKWNVQTTNLYHRDLSHVYFGSPYYWFNNYVIEESITTRRYPNQIVFGEGTQLKTFQTSVAIAIDIDYQIYAKEDMIFEIRDETYPPGFFGANDTKFETIRTEDNFKHALTLGPVTTMLNMWTLFKQGQQPFRFAFETPIVEMSGSLQITKVASDTIVFSLNFQSQQDASHPEESFVMSAQLKGNAWQNIQQTYQLWEPTVSG